MAFYNLSGTTKPSFKIGPNGVLLSSTVVTVGQNVTRKYLITPDQLNSNDSPYRLAFEDPDRPIYDTFISSTNVAGITTSGNQVTFNLRDGSTITLGTNEMVVGPNSSTDSAVPLFNGTTGKILKDSGRQISDEINDSTTAVASQNNLVSAAAVIDYVGSITELLESRLEGF